MKKHQSIVKKYFFIVSIISLHTLYGCIGTDVVDDLATGSFTVIIRPPDRSSLLIGETITLSAERRTAGGEVIPTESFQWRSSDSEIALVDGQGRVQALSPGQTEITALAGNDVSEAVLITVVMDESQIAEISLEAERTSLEIGEQIQLIATATSVTGDSLPVDAFMWESSDERVATVNASGLLTALDQGTTAIVAKVGEVASLPLQISVGINPAARSGTFQGSGSYTAKGTVSLELNGDKDVVLTTSQDFEADLALGTFLYLSNSTAGPATADEGIEVADISDNPKGVKTFNISDINGEIELTTYRYVVILCKPARITFGYADLNE